MQFPQQADDRQNTTLVADMNTSMNKEPAASKDERDSQKGSTQISTDFRFTNSLTGMHTLSISSGDLKLINKR